MQIHSFIKKELCCRGNVFKVYGSLNETDFFTIQRGTIKSSDSFYKKPANPLINIFLLNCIIIKFFFKHSIMWKYNEYKIMNSQE